MSSARSSRQSVPLQDPSSSAEDETSSDDAPVRAKASGPVAVPVASSSSSSSPKASPKSKAKAKASTQALRPPSPEVGRRRSSNSLVPHELQGLKEGDFEAAKVRRAVKAAAKRVKARRGNGGKKRVTSRAELLACLFNALGGSTGYLSSAQLLRMAGLLGFEGGEPEWEKEYLVLCRSYNWNPRRGASRRQFAELLGDEDSDAFSNDMELATMLSTLRVEAPKQLPREDLVKEFFNWADMKRSGRLGRRELLRFAKHLGFHGTNKDWDKEYEYMVRRYHWGAFFGGFRDSRDGCDLQQFSRMLADTEGLCFCDEAALQVELAELEMATGRPYFTRMISKEVQKADEDLRQKSVVSIQELWRGRVRARVLLQTLRAKLLNKKELARLLKQEEELKARMALAAARIWKWWKPIFIRRKWLKSMAALKASKEAKERQAKEAKRKEELQSKRLKDLSDLQDVEARQGQQLQLHASLLPPDAKRFKAKGSKQEKQELQELKQSVSRLQEKYNRTASSKFEGRKPKDWRQIQLPWSDSWEESAAGLIRKFGISQAMEDRYEVLSCKAVPFSLKDNRLLAPSGRRLVLQSDFPMLLNMKVWTIAELQRRLRQPDKELRQAQAHIQKQIEQLKRGRPGKLMDTAERQKLEDLRQEEAELKAKFQEARVEVEQLLQNRAVLMVQGIVRGFRTRRAQIKRRKAAQVIQRGWRGYLGHLKVQHLKVLVKQRMKQLKQVRNAESLFEAVHDLQEAIAIRVVRDKDFNCFVFRHAVSQQSMLHAAAQEGLHALTRELIAAAKLRGVDDFIAARDWRGWTALHTAAQSGQVESCKELLSAEELTGPGSLGRNGQTALHVAALQGHLQVCKVLLATQSFEEEVDRRDRWGRTALHLAVEQNHSAVAISIAEHGSFSSFDAKNAWGVSAMNLASDEMKEALKSAHERKLSAPRRRNAAAPGTEEVDESTPKAIPIATK